MQNKKIDKKRKNMSKYGNSYLYIDDDAFVTLQSMKLPKSLPF